MKERKAKFKPGDLLIFRIEEVHELGYTLSPGGVLPDKIPGYAAAAAENGGTRQ